MADHDQQGPLFRRVIARQRGVRRAVPQNGRRPSGDLGATGQAGQAARRTSGIRRCGACTRWRSRKCSSVTTATGADICRSATIEAIRCSMDGVRPRKPALSVETHRTCPPPSRRPYIGLFGTVLGIMWCSSAPRWPATSTSTPSPRAWPPRCLHSDRPVRRDPGAVRLQPPGHPQQGSQRRHGVFVDEFVARLAKMHDNRFANRMRPSPEPLGTGLGALTWLNASHDDDENAAVDRINITPLVDVLMVVLVMFILTATARSPGSRSTCPKPAPPCRWQRPKTKAIRSTTAARCSSTPTR